MNRVKFFSALFLSSYFMLSGYIYAAAVLYEKEPNNTPAEANKLSGPATIMGAMEGGDQDGYLWSVSDVDAQYSWSFELVGIADALTRVEILRITYTDNGKDIAKKETLFSFASRDGSRPVKTSDVIFETGDYLIGISRAGGKKKPSGLLAGKLDLATSGKSTQGMDGDAPETTQAPPQAQYRLNIAKAKRLNARSYANTQNKPLKLRPGQSYSIYSEDPATWASLELSDKDSKQRWEISGHTALGRTLNITLKDSSGKNLLRTTTDKSGRYTLPDLGLAKGKYFLYLEDRDADVIRTIAVKPTGIRVKGDEAEPNDRWQQANRVDLTKPVRGRAGKNNDYDYFIFSLSDEDASNTRTIKLDGTQGMTYQLCLLDSNKLQMQCRTAKGSISLVDLSLNPGDYGLYVSRSKKGAEYSLSMEVGAARKPIQEAEPNDNFKFAAAMNGKRLVKGRFAGEDTDYYRFTVTGKPQLWRIQATGDGIKRISLVNAEGATIQQFDMPAGSRRARLSNLFLLPGTHHVLVKGKDGSYMLRVLPIGPPNPDLEREPNDPQNRAETLRFGQTRIGLLENKADIDSYRLRLTNDDNIRLTIEPPVDGQIISRIYGVHKSGRLDSKPGKPIIIEGLFPPGDYTVRLSATVPSDAEYKIKLERLPRFSCNKGCEPAGVGVTAKKPDQLPVLIKLETGVNDVAAYLTYGQKLNGKLTLSNPTQEAVKVNLEVATSDYRWRAALDQMSVGIPAGSDVSVPVVIYVPKDAWADWPVRVSLRAYDPDGSQVETFKEIGVLTEAAPVEPVWDWQLPDEMLGGINVAWKALGGTRQPIENEQKGSYVPGLGRYFNQLFDNQSAVGKGLLLQGSRKRPGVPVTVDLAGEEPVEVVGIILNPMGRTSSLLESLGNFELQLSLDGTTFETVLKGRLKKLAVDQPFVLEKATPARFARLLLLSPQNDKPGGQLSLGEWKVIARPGQNITAGNGLNIANPEVGGHVAWASSSRSSQRDREILSEQVDNKPASVSAGQQVQWVIGFRDGRAARITRLEWVSVKTAKPEQRIKDAKVYVSMNSPVGPWQLIADWKIETDSTSVLKLELPHWARYVKFSTEGSEKRGTIALPETLRIFEQAADEQYRSILGEWGEASRDAIYELLAGLNIEPASDISSGNNNRENARLLEAASPVQGSVALGKGSNWYKISVPEGQNILELKLGGEPTVRTVVSLIDSNGQPVPARLNNSISNSHVYSATVKPGDNYFIKIDEPPRSVVFIWDNSGSVSSYRSMIYNAINSYVAGVRPGIDVVNLVVMGGGFLLKDWGGEPYVLQSTLNDYKAGANSSNSEQALIKATEALAKRPGTKGIVIITDALTGRDDKDLWPLLEKVRPRIFTIRVGSTHGIPEDLMQSWAGVNNGYADNPQTNAEIDRAFDRARTMLRQPAAYSLEASTSFEESPGPGMLKVVAKKQDLSGSAVELILDASGSMLKRLDGKRRINIAKQILTSAVTEIIPAGTPVALRVFGHKKANACQTDLEIKLKPLDPAYATKVISKINAKNLAKTPIADSLAKVESDLKKAKGKKIVILVTDGEETCEGDPAKVIKSLSDRGIDIRLNIVGFAIENISLKRQFEDWAKQGGGKYFDASDEASLDQSVKDALRAPYSVYTQAGELVAEGAVGGEPVILNTGFYRIKVSGSSPKVFEQVEIVGEKEKVLEY